MTVRLVLVSHAATAAIRQTRFSGDEPVEPHGIAVTGALRRIEQAYRGPELRCRQTAGALGLDDAAVDPALADLDVGGWRGRTLAELEADRPADVLRWLTDPDATPHGGEALSRLMGRVAAWLDGLPAGPARIAAVTHPAVVRAAVLHALGAPPAAFWRVDVTPLSQTWMSRRGRHWQLRETGHPLTSAAGPDRSD